MLPVSIAGRFRAFRSVYFRYFGCEMVELGLTSRLSFGQGALPCLPNSGGNVSFAAVLDHHGQEHTSKATFHT